MNYNLASMNPDRRIFLIIVILLNSAKTGLAQVPQIGPSGFKSEIADILPGNKLKYFTMPDDNKLDSTIYGPWITDSSKYFTMYKEIFGYDPFGNLTSDYQYEKTSLGSGAWKVTRKSGQTYDALNNLIQSTSYEWKDKWIPSGKREFSYEVNKKTEILYEWDLSTGRWVWLQKSADFFDNKGSAILSEYSTWDISRNQWDSYTIKNEITYNDHGSILIKISSIYSSGQWVKKSKNEYVYNSDNIQESSTNYLWNLSSGNWDPASKGEWSYNSSEKTWIWSKWDIASAEWVPTQMEYSHFNAENIDLKIISYWDRFASKWVLYEKFEWNYQDNGNKQEISGYLFEVDTNKWIENKKYYMYYSDHHSVIPENYINVYPNPATEFVVFSLKEISDSARIELYSIQGNKVIDQKLPVNGLLQINHLGVGLYLYRLNNKQIVYRGKFVKTGVLR